MLGPAATQAKKKKNYLKAMFLSHYIPDSFCAGAKTVSDRDSVHTYFTHKNGDFGAISVKERSCAPLISKVEFHILDGCSHYTGQHTKSYPA